MDMANSRANLLVDKFEGMKSRSHGRGTQFGEGLARSVSFGRNLNWIGEHIVKCGEDDDGVDCGVTKIGIDFFQNSKPMDGRKPCVLVTI